MKCSVKADIQKNKFMTIKKPEDQRPKTNKQMERRARILPSSVTLWIHHIGRALLFSNNTVFLMNKQHNRHSPRFDQNVFLEMVVESHFSWSNRR
jgi:hypothetical protein